jgi:hypothetical protein
MADDWQASDIFDVIRHLVDESPVMTDFQKTLSHALIDAHGSQYVANTDRFHHLLGVHGQLIGLPPGSPQEKSALADQQ